MNYPIWDVPASGLFIALISVFHVFISHFAVGAGLFLVVTERKARREGDTALLEYVKRHSRFFMLVSLVLGAITGVGIWFSIALVNPQGTSSLINTFVWGWALEWTFFIIEIAAAMVYYYGWERLDEKTHELVGWIYFVAAWASLFIINGIVAYMLTPGRWVETHRFWDGFFNETFWPSVFARTFVSIGLAGLYALLTISVSKDRELKARMATYAGGYWVMPMVIALPLSLVWYLSAAIGAGVPAGKIMGAEGGGVGAILGAIFSGGTGSGYPNAHRAALIALVASALAALLTLVIMFLRRRSFGLLSTVLLLVLGQVAFAGGEWMREDLRKPYVIGKYMFVNGVRLPPRPGVPGPPAELAEALRDRFTVTALSRTGVLGASLWWPAPEGFDPQDGPTGDLTPEARADLDARAGERVFKLLCFNCHTLDGYVAIEPLVEGRTVGAIEKVLGTLARPVDAAGEAVGWDSPDLHLKTRLGRRMPPFVGTEAEKHALAVYLARVGGDAEAGIERAAPPELGATVFDDNCAMCHGPDEDWPMTERLEGRSADEFYDLIGRLPEVNDYMDPFEGSDAERRALAEYLAGMEE